MEPIIIIGAGLLAYFLWSQSQGASGGLPSDAVYLGPGGPGQELAVPQSAVAISGPGGFVAGPAPGAATYLYYGPSEKLYYLVFTAPTAAQQSAGQAFLAAAAASSTAAPTTSSMSPTSGTAPPPTALPTCPGYGEWTLYNAGAAAGKITLSCVAAGEPAPAGPAPTPVCPTGYTGTGLTTCSLSGLSGFRGMGAIRSPYWA
jgi:hypothetical protein